MNLLIRVSIILLAGVLGGRIAKAIKIPYITGYLLGGLLIGPSFAGIITDTHVKSFSIVNDIALAAIAFTIGSEFLIEELRKVGKKIFLVTLSESLATMLAVFTMSYLLLGQSFYISILIATIAAATAPAATTMIIRQYNAKGPLTKTILPVVAIDDAFCVIGFGIAMAVTKMSLGTENVGLLKMLTYPIAEILGSLVIGFILGILLTLIGNKSKNEGELLTLILAFIIAGAGISNALHLSPILMCMMVGATVTNLMHGYRRVFDAIGKFTPPIYLFFFTLAGASLHLSALGQLELLGIGYVIARAVGKISGAAFGAKMTGYPDVVVKNLGLSLLPQAGVAIGLSMLVKQQLPDIGGTVSTVVLGGVFVYEIIGPIIAKNALSRAGEIYEDIHIAELESVKK